MNELWKCWVGFIGLGCMVLAAGNIIQWLLRQMFTRLERWVKAQEKQRNKNLKLMAYRLQKRKHS